MQIVCHTGGSGGLTVTGLKLLESSFFHNFWVDMSDQMHALKAPMGSCYEELKDFGKLKTCFEDFRSTWMTDLLEIYWYAALFGLSLGRFHRSPLCRQIFLAAKLRRRKWLCCKHETYQAVPPCEVFVEVLWQKMGMDQYLLIPFLGGWTSIYQLFWCELQGYYWFWHTARWRWRWVFCS